ncbi:HAD-IA family hydrolase [Elusimicrobiota bacterium]
MDIELILFDFGGVLAPEGFQLGILKLAHVFNKSFEEMYNVAGYKAGRESGYTAGLIDEDEYWKIVAKMLGEDKDLKPYRYVFLDNFQPRDGMVELIGKLRKDYKTGLFSDQTNWLYDLDEKYNFMQLFDFDFVSCKLHFTKHDDEFYKIPAEKTGIPPDKIIVIDDKPRVIDKCIQAGMHTHLFTSIEDCCEYLTNLKKL